MFCVNRSLPEFKALAKKFDVFPLEIMIMEYQDKNKTNDFPPEDYLKQTIGYKDSYINNNVLDNNLALQLAKKLSDKFKVPYKIMSYKEAKELHPDIDKDVNAFWDGKTGEIILIDGKFNGSTVFHEFTHPLIEYIYQNNNTLFTYLKSQLKNPDGSRMSYLQVKAYLANKGYSSAQMSMDDVYKEAMVNMIQQEAEQITKGILNKPSNIFEKFWNYVKKVLGLINPYLNQLDILQVSQMSFNDLAQYVFINDGFDLSQIRAENKYAQRVENISPEHTEAYNYQIDRLSGKLTDIQKAEANKLILSSANYQANNDNYINQTTGKILTRVSQYKKNIEGPQGQKEYFAFDEDEDKYFERREFGNQLDGLANAVIRGLSFEDSLKYVREKQTERALVKPELLNISITDDELEKSYNQLKELIDNELSDYFLLPQIIFGNNKMGIAGTADIVAIGKDGRIRIIDVKTSKYKAITDNGDFTFDYTEQFANKTRASKLEGYRLQLSFYKGMALEEGYVFEDENELQLIPTYLENQQLEDGGTNENIIDNTEVEGLKSIESYNYIIKLFKEGPSKEFTKTEKEVLDKILANVLERIEILKRNPHVKNKKYREKELQNLYDTVTTVERSKALYSFLQDAYNNIVSKHVESKNYDIKGAVDKINFIEAKYKSGKLTADEALEELYYFKNLAELYRPIVEEIQNLLITESAEGFNVNSDNKALIMIKDIIAAVSNIQTDYKKNAVPIIADILYNQVDEGLNERIKTALNERRNSLADVEAKYGKESKEYLKAKKDYDFWLNRSRTENGITKDYLIKVLQTGAEEDVSFLDAKLSPIISSRSELASLSAKLIKERFENARQQSIEVIHQADKAFTTYSKGNKPTNIAEANKPFYNVVEVYDGLDEEGKAKYRKEYHFVQQLDETAYNKVKGVLQENINKTDDSKARTQLKKEFIRNNHILRPQEDVTITNPETGEKVVIIKGLNTLIKEKQELVDQGIESQHDMDNYLKRMKGTVENGNIYYNEEFTIPDYNKFSNEKFNKLSLTEKNYYNYMIATYFKSQERTPLQQTYRIPSVVKSGFERTLENGVIDYLKYLRDDSFKELAEDIDRYGETKTVSGFKVIPVLYANQMDINDVSLDLLSSVLKYDSATLIYEAQSKSQPFAESLLQIVKEKPPIKTDTLGRKIADKLVANIPGISENVKFISKSENENNLYMLLNSFFDAQVYGVKRIPQNVKIGNTVLKLDKITDMVKGFASKTQIGGLNVIGGVANYLQANISLAIETAAKQYVSDKSLAWAKAEYYKNSVKYINDLRSGVATSHLGQLAELYDPLQGNYKDQYGRRITKSMFKKLLASNSWFFLHKAGEHAIHMQMFLAYLKDTKVMQNGKSISLYDTYEQVNGKIKLKEGVVLPGKLTKNGLVPILHQNRLHALDKRLNGVYNDFDAPELKKHWYGSLLFMYRDYIVPGFKRRYKTLTVDQEFSDYNEGYWNTFFRILKKDYKQLMRYAVGLDKPNTIIDKFEQQNCLRAARELAIVFGTGMLIIILNSLIAAADDDDKEKFTHLLYMTMKLNQELGAYGTFGDPNNLLVPNVNEMFRTLSQPTVAMGTIKRMFKVWTILTTDPLAVYEKDTGIFEKGDSKLLAAMLKLSGITGVNINPEESIKYMKMLK